MVGRAFKKTNLKPGFGVSVLAVLCIVLVWVTVLICGALAAPTLLRVQRIPLVAQLLSFPLLVIALGGAGLITAVILYVTTGAPVWLVEALLLGVFTAVTCWRFYRAGLRNPAMAAAADADETGGLVVLGWNTLGDNVPVAYMRDVILRVQPDAVGLPETTRERVAELAAALTVAGYPMRGWGVGPQDGHDPHETGLLVKTAFGEYTVQRLHVLGASTLEATPVDATAPRFVAVHTVAPRLRMHGAWAADLQMLATRYAGARNTVLVGDFNATVTHMRGLGDDENRAAVLGSLMDAAASLRGSGHGTWPVGKPSLLGTQIDHVLHSPDYVASGFLVLTECDDSGSDHRAIVAVLGSR